MTDKGKPSTRHIDRPAWLRSVRDDLDSKAEGWAVRTHPGFVSQLEAIGAYLDIILTELGARSQPHACPECGVRHQREDPRE